MYGLWRKGSGVDVKTCLEMILAYVEGAILPRHVYLQGPEANMCLRAFFVSRDEIGAFRFIGMVDRL